MEEERFTFVKYRGVVYPNYIVSSEGYVISYKPCGGTKKRILKPKISNGYKRVQIYDENGYVKHCFVHKIVYESFHLFEDIQEMTIDNIDTCKTNNKLPNLRVCSQSQNLCNQGVHRNNKLGIKGISKTKFGTYQCRVEFSRRTYHKTFKTIDEGRQWLHEQRIKHHGEYARDA